MKPTHRYKDGRKLCYVSIKFTVDTDIIERAICEMIDNDYQLSRKLVEKRIRKLLHDGGNDFFGTGFFDDDRWYGDIREIQVKAEEKAKELFPDYY